MVRINRVDHTYNLSDNIIEINRTLYNIQWEGKHPIIVNNNRSRMDTSPLIGKSAKPAITSYLACLAKEEWIKQICFLLAQCATESCSIPKSLVDVIRLLSDIQKKWLESCLEKLKSLKDRNVYEVVNLSKRRKVINNCWIFNIKSDGYYKS